MKKKGLAKYTISLLVCFFAFLGFSNAAANTYNDQWLTYGQWFPIGGTNFVNMRCEYSGTDDTVITQNDGSGVSKILYQNQVDSSVKPNVHCYWDDRVGIGETRGPGEAIYNFNLENNPSQIHGSGSVPVSAIAITINAENGVTSGADLIQYIGGASIKSHTTPSGREYIEFEGGSCSGTKCKIMPSDFVKQVSGTDSLHVSFDITYDLNGEEVTSTVNITINAINFVRLFPGSYGTCELSGWSNGTYHNSTFYTINSSSATLPNCNSNNTDGLVEFKGWSKVTFGQATITASNMCPSGELVPAGSTAEAGGTYMACYQEAPNVIVSFSRGTLNASSDWKAVRNTTNTYVYSGGSSVALPDLSDVDGFKGWRKGGTTGQLFEAGSSVPTDGSRYYAEIERTVVYRDMNKVVRKGKTVAIVIPAGISSCSSNNPDVVTATVSGGECQVQSNAESDGDSAQVVVVLENGQTVTYTYTVLPEINRENADFFVDTSINFEWGVNYSGQDGSSASDSGFNDVACETLELQWGGKTSDYGLMFGDVVNKTNAGLVMSSSYKTRTTCADDSNSYWSFCLDPGLHGPDSSYSWEKYTVTDDLKNNSDSRLLKLVTYLSESSGIDISSIVTQNDNPDKNAIHHATRFAAMMDGLDSGEGSFPTRYHYYRNTATAIQACSATDQSCIKDAILNNFDNEDTSTGSRSALAEKIASYFANSANVDTITGDTERTIDSTEVTTEGSTITNVVKGTISLPQQVEGVTLEPCGSNSFGITCLPATITEVGTEDGKKIFEYEVTMTRQVGQGKLPESDAEKKSVSYKLSYNGSGTQNMHLAVSVDHRTEWQRMLVFTIGDAAIYAYFPFEIDCEAYIPGLEGYLTEDTASSYPYKDEFVSAGCCAYLHDEGTYGAFLDENCGERCTTNTLNQVCSYSPTSGKVDVYRIKEGHKNDSPRIGTCIVNVSEKYSAGSSNFTRTDDVGNKLNIKEYAGSTNEYCEVTCREDWTMVMEAFGNFVGKNAVAAGTYFKTQTDDLFIGTKRECYTSYIDYQSFVKEMTDLSNEVVQTYNKYSEYAHVYADIKKQDSSSTYFTTSKDSGCLKIISCAEANGGDTDYFYSEDEGGCVKSVECPEPAEGEEPSSDPCYEAGTTPECEGNGQVNYYKLTTMSGSDKIDSGDKDKRYNTKLEDDNSNNDNVVTKKRLLDGGTAMKDVYKSETEISCGTVTWAEKPGEEASMGSCIATESGLGSTTALDNYCNSESDILDGFCVENDTFDKDTAFDAMQQFILNEYESAAASKRTDLTSKTRTIYQKDEKFYACQHIQLNNNSSLPTNNASGTPYSSNKKYLGKTYKYTTVDSRFEPGATYSYDDQAYMTLLGKDNLIEQYVERNDQVLGQDYSSAQNVKKEFEISNVNTADGGETTDKVDLAKNYLETTYYHTAADKIWTEANVGEDVINKYDNGSGQLFEKADVNTYDPKEGRIVLCEISAGTTPKYNDTEFDLEEELVAAGTDDPDWKSGSCFQVYLRYNDINYIKTSIENSSFYKNKGNWYFSNSNGLFVAHGDTPEDALSKLRGTNGNKMDSVPDDTKYWYAPAKINVFPISYSTPRNIYTYTYNFGDMGYYSENGNLGRIMGGKKSVIQENSRTCFYEVYEEACICCGSETYDYSYNETVEAASASMAGEMGYPSGMVKQDILEQNKNGTLSIVPSAVQLADLNSDSNRELASNWGTSSFYYDGVLYETKKGSELIKEIEAKGETIYSKNSDSSDLEYEYVLTPSDISSIKEYNDQYGYGISYDRLKIIDRYANGEADNKLNLNDADSISFMHYGSTFLEDFLPADVTKKALYEGGNEKVCYVTAGQVEGSTTSNPVLHNKMKNENCRWIDYVTPANSPAPLGDTYGAGILNKPSNLRMAFK